MTDTAPPPPKRLSLTRMDAGLAALRTMMINIGFFAAMILLVPTMGAQIISNPVVIEPIAVPQLLADRGMTPAVAANRVWDGLQEFSASAVLVRQTLVAVPDSQLVEFTLPGSTLSIESVLKQVRQFLGVEETHIVGEIVCQTADCTPQGQRLRLRVIRRTTEVVDMPPMGTTPPEIYFRDAAGAVFDILDPLVAAAARTITDPEGAMARAHQIAARGGPDAAWAQALMGDISLGDGDPVRAGEHYAHALAIDPGLIQARLGLVRSSLARNEVDGAAAGLEQIASHPDFAPEIAMLRAELALERDETDEALAHALAAAEADPGAARPLIRAGEIAHQAGLVGRAEEALRNALAIDPGAADALSLLSDIYRDRGDLRAAETLLADWAAFAPDSAEALRALVALRSEGDNAEGVAEAYARLAALGVLTSAERLDYAKWLDALDRRAQAQDVLSPLVESDLPLPEAVLALARLHDDAGRKERARTLYERYLTLGTDLPGREEAEAALENTDG